VKTIPRAARRGTRPDASQAQHGHRPADNRSLHVDKATAHRARSVHRLAALRERVVEWIRDGNTLEEFNWHRCTAAQRSAIEAEIPLRIANAQNRQVKQLRLGVDLNTASIHACRVQGSDHERRLQALERVESNWQRSLAAEIERRRADPDCSNAATPRNDTCNGTVVPPCRGSG